MDETDPLKMQRAAQEEAAPADSRPAGGARDDAAFLFASRPNGSAAVTDQAASMSDAPKAALTPDDAAHPGEAPGEAPADSVSETDVDALLHQVKVAAGVEDDYPEESAAKAGESTSDPDRPDGEEGILAISAPLPVAPERTRTVDQKAVRRVLDQGQGASYGSEADRRAVLIAQEADERRNRTVAAAIGLALVAVLALFAGYTAWSVVSNQQAQATWDAEHQPVSVTLAVQMPQVEGVSQGTRIPVTVRGADLDGNAVDETRYLNWDGTGLELTQGSYTLSVAASPIGSDGTIYQVPTDALSVEVTRDQPDLTSAGTFAFAEIPAAEVTDDQINAAAQYAGADTVLTTDQELELQALAQTKRDNAVTQQQAEEAARQAEERARYLVDCDAYSFEIPEYWRDKVTVRQDGTTAIIYPTGAPNRLCTVYVRPSSETAAGDIGNSLIYQTPLANGSTLVVWAPRWAYLVAEAQDAGTAEEDGYTAELAQTLVDLQTGGAWTYSAAHADIEENGDDAESIFAVDDFLTQTIVGSLELK